MKNSKLFETHVNTVNLERAIQFYQSLDLVLAYKLEDRRAAFFWLGDSEKKEQMLGIWEVSKEQFTKNHFAFQVPLDDLLAVPAFLESKGIQLRESFGLKPVEPVVHAWMPAASYYFLDPDGNSLEYISVLEDEPNPELGAVYLSDWKMHVSAMALKK